MTFVWIILVLAVCAGVVYFQKRRETVAPGLIKRELGRFRAGNKINPIRASELSDVIKKLDATALKSGRVRFEYFDNERILVAYLLDLAVYARCNLMEYMDLTRLIDHTVRRAGL